MAETPADEIRRAAALMRQRAQAVPQGEWAGRPWGAEQCSDDEAGNCACIVYQGEYKPYNEPQVPPIQYVADAETPEHAAHIAGMHPLVALAVADWLDAEAERADGADGVDVSDLYPKWLSTFSHSLAIVRAYLGEARNG